MKANQIMKYGPAEEQIVMRFVRDLLDRNAEAAFERCSAACKAEYPPDELLQTFDALVPQDEDEPETTADPWPSDGLELDVCCQWPTICVGFHHDDWGCSEALFVNAIVQEQGEPKIDELIFHRP